MQQSGLTLTLAPALALTLALTLTLPQNPNPNPEPGPEQVISETTETEVVVGLAAMRRATFAYTLANGTLGVYAQPGQRTWRVKSKHDACALIGFDLDGDGQPEVISGWSNGKLEVRSDP